MNIRSEKLLKMLSIIIFILYMIILVWVIIFKCNMLQSVESTYIFFKGFTLKERFEYFLIPFMDYFEGPFVNEFERTFSDDVLNVLIFIPFGLYVSYFIKKNKFGKVVLLSFLLSLFFEMFQLFSAIGCYSTKDLITNVLGGIFGFLLYKILYKENQSIRYIILNICSCLVIIAILPIAIYAVVNTCKCFDYYLNVISKTYA